MDFKLAKSVKSCVAALFLLVLATGCSEIESVLPPHTYVFDNQSGHTVALAYLTRYQPEYNPVPEIDSLVVLPGERYTWEDHYRHFPYDALKQQHKTGNIYYDARYKIAASALPVERRFTAIGAFQGEDVFEENSSGEYIHYFTYVFTEEDYAYAVEHGTDLHAKP